MEVLRKMQAAERPFLTLGAALFLALAEAAVRYVDALRKARPTEQPLLVLAAALFFVLTGTVFRLHALDSAVPRVRMLMPGSFQPGQPEQVRDGFVLDPRADAGRHYRRINARNMLAAAERNCRPGEDAPSGAQLDACMVLAGAGDVRAQAAVAQFYLTGSTLAAQAEAFAWLSAVATGNNERLASIARLELGRMSDRFDRDTLERAETLADKYVDRYAR